MSLKLSKNKILFLTFALICTYSSLQFLLILRHKSAYVSDSYFYKHLLYEYQGDSFSEAKQKIRNEIDISSQDKIAMNIFFNDENYSEVYGYFSKRPLYPLISSFISNLFGNHVALLLPVFAAYLGLISATFYIFQNRLNLFWSALGTFVFVSFYPFLDWSTYYLTDTIGAFFWMAQILLILKIIQTGKKHFMLSFILLLIISLLNREQSALILIVPAVIGIQSLITKEKKVFLRSLEIFIITSMVSALYIAASLLFFKKNLIDTIIYTMNQYGLNKNSYTARQIASYLLTSYKSSHIQLLKDLVSHHLWFLFFTFSILGTVLFKKRKILDYIMLGSAVASYSAIYLYPVLSYRYFFPVVISVCYFSALFLYKISISVQNNTGN